MSDSNKAAWTSAVPTDNPLPTILGSSGCAPKQDHHDSDGFRVVASVVKKAPNLSYLLGVSLCPGCGACVADCMMEPEKQDIPKPDSMKAFKKQAKEHPRCMPTCEVPIQLEMGAEKEAKAQQMRKVDCYLSCCSPAARIILPFQLFAYTVPAILAAKYGLGSITMKMIAGALSFSFMVWLLSFCFPSLNLNTPSMNDVVLNIIDMKTADKREDVEVGKGPYFGMVSHHVGRACKYAFAILKGICCCKFLMPRIVLTFAKVLFVMLFTEIGIVVSAWLYIVPRFLCGSVTWTVCSCAGWFKEFFNTMAIKERITHMRYPAWGFQDSDIDNIDNASKCKPDLENDVEKNAEDEDQNGCCCSECPWSYCPCGLEICCELGCGLLCEMSCALFNVIFEVFGELVSAILVVGKAMVYVDRLVNVVTPLEVIAS